MIMLYYNNHVAISFKLIINVYITTYELPYNVLIIFTYILLYHQINILYIL